MAAPRERLRRTVRHRVVRALLVLFVIGAGVSTTVSAIENRTETVTARVSAGMPYAYTHADNLDFKFADGTTANELASSDGYLFDAVTRFGPGPARVTRNAHDQTIYKVEFHGKTYTLETRADDLVAGIILLVLGLLGLVYVALTWRDPPAPATAPAK
jgi:hypothetical protein